MNLETIKDTVMVFDVTPPISVGEYILQPSTLISFFALIASLISLLFTVRYSRQTLRLTEVHNALLVKPMFNFISNNSSGSIEFILHNVGTGPGIVQSYEIIYDGKKFKNVDEAIRNIEKDGKEELLGGVIATLDNDYILGCGQEVKIYRSKEIPTNINTKTRFFEGVQLKVCYSDIYNNSFELKEILFSE